MEDFSSAVCCNEARDDESLFALFTDIVLLHHTS